jgi:hypothetical protein
MANGLPRDHYRRSRPQLAPRKWRFRLGVLLRIGAEGGFAGRTTKIDKNPLPSIARLALPQRTRLGRCAAPNPMGIQAHAASGECVPSRLLPRVEQNIADGAQYERHNTRHYDRSHCQLSRPTHTLT